MQHSPGYIIGFTAVVCLVCAVFVAGSAVSLKERQDANIVLDRQKKVLIVSGLMGEKDKLSAIEIGELFNERVTPRAVTLASGSYNEKIDAASYDQRKAAKNPALSEAVPPNAAKVRRVPNVGLVYQVRSAAGEIEAIIIPIEGMGLWSTLYGYLALAPDTRTIKGITFYEHGETPGLGGEVDNARWKSLWKGRLAFDERWVPRIGVVKGMAGSVADDPYNVDGLSGATITSRGVGSLVKYWLGDSGFGPYLAKLRAEQS
ncbi:MAG: Na(+)-translocating NADH-quinone reductase subunit C [Myxococcales bacterium]|nr:Na(+)-translocating NADH-quinone reductase subunit C [Myxococcales bacterium]MCH7867420.1 Na(+)-translocating NADH-quinone reductase subunit C [Myxococcales bacterium]